MESVIWLIIIVLTIVAEAVTAGLVSIWFTIGAIGGFITSFFTDNSLIQVIIFVIVSIAALLITRPFVKKLLPKGAPKTNVNELIGKDAIVIKELSDKKMGHIKVNGQTWSALNIEKGNILVDTEVEVISIEGVKLIVRKKDV